MIQASDEEIMANVKNGDLDALSILFNRYKAYIYNFYLRMGIGEANALDNTQQVFYRILKYRHSYLDGSKFKTWIFKIARNVMLKSFDKHHDFRAELNEQWSSDDAADSDLNEDIQLLYQCIDKLSATDKEIITLHRFQGMKYEEISSITGLTVSAIKVRVHRALARLREFYFELA